jgi:excisionase family DNA binding protein
MTPRGQSQGTVSPEPRVNGAAPARREHKESSALLTLDAVAQRCAVSVWTVRGWVDNGRLPVLRLPGRLVRVEPAALAQFLEGCRA